MSGWQTQQIGHYPGYEMISVDDIIGKQCYILKCEQDQIINERGTTPVVHFLVHLIDDDKDYEIRTGAQAIVRTIANMAPHEIERLIKKQEVTSFVKEKTAKGFTLYKMI